MKDKDIRRVIFDYLEENVNKIRIFEESPIKNSRCDFYTVTDRLTGYEIKSDADSYERLARQIKDYDTFFDENYIVIGATHKIHVAKKIPEHWGIICITDTDEGFEVETLRPAKPNPKLKRRNQILKLWNPEISSVLRQNKLHVYNGKSKAFRAAYMIKSVPDEKLREHICHELFERDYRLSEENV